MYNTQKYKQGEREKERQQKSQSGRVGSCSIMFPVKCMDVKQKAATRQHTHRSEMCVSMLTSVCIVYVCELYDARHARGSCVYVYEYDSKQYNISSIYGYHNYRMSLNGVYLCICVYVCVCIIFKKNYYSLKQWILCLGGHMTVLLLILG